MSKQDIIETTGKVTESEGYGFFRVELETGQIIVCKLTGKMRQHKIRLVAGDRVIVEMTPYDLTKGRIKHRL